MEFKASKSDLVRELSLLQGAVEEGELPALSRVLIEARDNCVQLTTTNLSLYMRSSFAAKVKTPGQSCLPAKLLVSLVKRLDDGAVKMELLKDGMVSISSGSTQVKLVGAPCEHFPVFPQCPDELVDIPSFILGVMINRTRFAISEEESRYTLNGAMLSITPDGITMAATDGHRLAVSEQLRIHNVELTEVRVVVPTEALDEIQTLLTEPAAKVHFAKNSDNLFVNIGDRLIVSRRLGGSFPNYKSVIPKDNPIHVTVGREEFVSAVQRAVLISNMVRLSLSKAQLKVSAFDPESGEAADNLTVVYSGPDFSAMYNAKYLIDFFEHIREDRVAFEFKNEESPALMYPLDSHGSRTASSIGGDYCYVVMPLRV